ncbi:LacI family DNA-binding transcriptional regulator [Bacillus sp. 1P06AnD]|uniref:LacI family DNA-binding transcriptional regulator n=1 Tax=Bacillus sp. 1P06AnD TaxID=3132208 RepID=UPI0039A37172
MTTTIADIARIAGVAKSTVSRYLNGGSVSEPTAKLIENVIAQTGYTPNRFAQSLKAKQTKIIGTVVPRLDSFATSQTLIGIDEQLRELDYQLMISNTSQNLDREIESIYTLQKQKVAGIILLATSITERHLQAFRQIGIPVILMGQQHDECYSVIHDDFHAGYDLGKAVLAKGHRNIAYLGVTENDVAVGLERKRGFKRAVGEQKDCLVHYYESTFKIEDAIAIVPSIIKECQPSLIVCATDNIAFGALKAIQKEGYRIPEQISVTGFGGYSMTEFTNPELTTVKFFYQEAGHTAARKLISLLQGDEIEKITYSKYQIIDRESVDSR